MKAIQDLKTKSVDELKRELADAKLELSKLLARVRLGQEKNVANVGKLRKKIARIMYLISDSNQKAVAS